MQYLWCFLVGGAICAVAQVLINYTSITPARILVLFVAVGAVLTYAGLYQPLVEYAGAGATVPITGFGYSLAKGVMQAVDEKRALGILTGGITSVAAGLTAAITFGYIFALLGKSRTKS